MSVLKNQIITKLNCIFCKKNSDHSLSREHIIPESLGNKEHVLPKGMVCDECNSYFAIKIENTLLSQEYFRYTRSVLDVFSKKSKPIPATGVIVHPKGGKIDVYKDVSGTYLDISNPDIINLIKNKQVNRLYIPHHIEPESHNIPLSRLLGKIALEALTQRLMHIEGWEKEVTDKKELDPLRSYVRYGPGKIKFWEYSQRLLYPPNFIFKGVNGETYDVLHEYTFHYSEDSELFLVVAIFGIEYAINIGGPDISSFKDLVKKNNGKSFLY